MRRLLDSAVGRYGYEIRPRSHVSLGAESSVMALAAHLRKLFEAVKIGTVIDVGANQGQYRDFLRDHVGFRGTIISFEPIPDLAEALVERARSDEGWRVYPYALGSTAAILPLHISERSGWSSLLEKESSPRTEVADSVQVTRSVDVKVAALDQVLSTEEPGILETGVYLKIDAQGYDLEVLRGAAQSLPFIPALQSELELVPVYANAPPFLRVIEFLLDEGFEITGVFPVWRDRLMRIGEMDTVFRRTRDHDGTEGRRRA